MKVIIKTKFSETEAERRRKIQDAKETVIDATIKQLVKMNAGNFKPLTYYNDL